MSQINTRILRVPGTTSGQIDERAIGSFSAPMEAAGKAMSSLGELGQQIAFREQKLDDTLLMNDLDTEMADIQGRAKVAMSEATSAKEIESIQRSLDADFASIGERAKGIRGDEEAAKFMNRVNLTGGLTSLEVGNAAREFKVQVGKMNKDKYARERIEEGLASGDLDGAIEDIRNSYQEGVGTLYDDRDDIEGMVDKVAGYAAEIHWSTLVDNGEATTEGIASAKHLSFAQRHKLQQLHHQKKEGKEAEADRAFDNQIMKNIPRLSAGEDSLQSLGIIRRGIEHHYKDDAGAAANLYYGFASKMITEHGSQKLAEARDMDGGSAYLMERAGELDVLIAAEEDESIKKMLRNQKELFEKSAEHMDTIPAKKEAEDLRIAKESMDETVRAHRRAAQEEINSKVDPKLQASVDAYRNKILDAVGLRGVSKLEAARAGVTASNYEKIHEYVDAAAADLIAQNRTPETTVVDRAIETKDPAAIEAVGQMAFDKKDDYSELVEMLEDPNGLANAKGSPLAVVVETAPYKAAADIQTFFLSMESPRAAADLWWNGAKNIPLFDYEKETNPMKAKILRAQAEYLQSIAQNPDADRDELAEKAFRKLAPTFEGAVEVSHALTSEKDQAAFYKLFGEMIEGTMTDEERLEAGGKAFEQATIDALVENGLAKDETAARIMVKEDFLKDLRRAALHVARVNGKLNDMLSVGNADQIDGDSVNSVFSKAAGGLLRFSGPSRITPASPGKLDHSSYAPEKVYDFSGGRERTFVKSNVGDPSLPPGYDTVRASGDAPWIVAMFNGLDERLGGEVSDEDWLIELKDADPEAVILLKDLYRDVQAMKKSIGEAGTGKWITSRQDQMQSVTDVRRAISEDFSEIPLRGFLSKPITSYPKEASLSSDKVKRLLEMGIIVGGRGEPLTAEELEIVNADRRLRKSQGYDVDELDYGFKTQWSINPKYGESSLTWETMPTTETAIYDIRATEAAGEWMHSMGTATAPKPSLKREQQEESPLSNLPGRRPKAGLYERPGS